MNQRVKAKGLLVTLASAFIICCGCCGCGKQTIGQAGVKVTPAYQKGRELYLQIETKKEAERIAKLYEISLVDFNYGVAVYHTGENPEDVIARGEKNNWPRLSINFTHKLSEHSMDYEKED